MIRLPFDVSISYEYLIYYVVVVATLTIGAILYFIVKDSKSPDYMNPKNLPAVIYEVEDRKKFYEYYQLTGNIEGMLYYYARHSGNKKQRKRVMEAERYLKFSRYRDYETALFTYVSDGNTATNIVLNDIILQDARRRTGLPMKKEG
ncbi:MAG: hypothetical protein Q4E53_10405 [Eubacteriales bacterium]|nr:hypothetical protein [Eubacteriales bacterium]